jgi:uncharacterized membrane protein
MIHLLIDTHVIVAVTIGGIAIVYAAALWFMPRLTRPDLYFAVTVPPGFRDEPDGKSILGRYRTELILLSILALIVFVAGIAWVGVRFVSTGLIIQAVAGFIAFYRARIRVRPHAVQPTMIREAELHEHNRIIPGGWIVASGPFVLIAVCAGYLWIHGASQNDLNAGVHQDASPARSFIVYLLSTTGRLAGLSVLLYGIARWVRPVNSGGPERARELQFRRTVAAVVLGAEYYVAIQASWLILAPNRRDLIGLGLLLFAFVFALAVIVVLARLGQGGSRLVAAEKSAMASAVPVGDRTLDQYWKLGVFYFNREDSAIFVEKRFGLGYSLNFARPTAWVILALLLLAPLVPIVAHLAQFLPKHGV